MVIHELLAVEVWKRKVFPLLLQQLEECKTSFPAYIVVRLWAWHASIDVSRDVPMFVICQFCEFTVVFLFRQLYHEATLVGLLETAMFYEVCMYVCVCDEK